MSQNKFYKEIFKNTSLTLLFSNLSSIIFFIAQNILIYNWASKDSTEDFTVFLAYIDFLLLFILISPALIPKIINETDDKRASYLMKSISFFLFFNILIIFLIFFIFIWIGFQFNISNIPVPLFLTILVLTIMAISFFNTIESLYYGLRKIKKIGLLKISFSIIFFSLVFILQIFSNLIFFNLMMIYLISYFCAIILVIRSKIKFFLTIRKPNFNFNMKLVKKNIDFSYPLLLMNIFYFINFKAGILILNNLDGINSIYYYLSTSMVILFIGFIGRPLNNMIYSYVVEFFKEKKKEKIKEAYNFILSVISITILVGLIFMYTVSQLIINLFYSKYYSETFFLFLKLIIIGGLFYSLNQFLGKFIIAKGNTKINLLAEFLGGIANILSFILCLIFRNIIISGIGFIISTIIIFLIYIYYSKKFIGLSIKRLKGFQVILSCLLSISIFELIYHFFPFLFICIISSLVIYFLLIIIFDITSLYQIKGIANMVLEIFKGIIQKKE